MLHYPFVYSPIEKLFPNALVQWFIMGALPYRQANLICRTEIGGITSASLYGMRYQNYIDMLGQMVCGGRCLWSEGKDLAWSTTSIRHSTFSESGFVIVRF